MILGGGSQNYIRGTSSLDAPSRKIFYTQNEYFGISNCIFNSNLLALVVSKILGRSQIYTIGEPTHPWRPLAEKFLFAKRVLYNI